MTSDPYATKVLVRSSAAKLWQDAVALVAFNGEKVEPVSSPSSPSAGMGTVEVRGVKMVLVRPLSRYIISSARPLVPGFCLGNYLYFLSGSNEIGPLTYYNPLTPKFSDDGKTLHGAYAPRLVPQFDYLQSLLLEDSTSRRAVAQIFDPTLDHRVSKDIPCPISFQFLVRNGELEMHVMMRSQNIAMVFPYDIFLFTMIQEWLARELELKLGVYVQYVVSLHYYENEIALVESIMHDQVSTFEMPEMPPLKMNYPELMSIERAWRNYGLSMPGAPKPERSPMEDSYYWAGITYILKHVAEARRANNEQLRDDSLIQYAWGRVVN